MPKLVPHAETTATSLARMLRVSQGGAAPRSEPAMSRANAAKRLLEELGVRCGESAALQDLKGFLLSSQRGTEIIVRHDLSDDERLEVYAHLIAHALLGPNHPQLSPAAKFEYLPGRAPEARPVQEIREEGVANAVARAILEGRLEAAPRLVYCHDLGTARGRFSLAVLRGIHTGSLALYRRSRRYQRLRSLPAFAAFTERVHSLLGAPA